jgi:hypothetical protein
MINSFIIVREFKMSKIVVIHVIILSLLMLSSDCDQSKDDDSGKNMKPPVLKNLGVEFAPYNPLTSRAGDFIFDARYEKVFWEYGVTVSDGLGGTKALHGFITGVHDQDGVDYEIWIHTAPKNSAWTLNIDHITNPRVSVGQAVSAGDTVGNPGPWDATVGRVEIMLAEQTENAYWAPFACFDPDSLDVYQNKVWTIMEEWETFKGDTTLYDETTMRDHFAGCLGTVYYDTTSDGS